jgi:serine/threonine-protein kinase RsbW
MTNEQTAEMVFCRTFRGERKELAAVRRFAGEVLPADCPVLADLVLMLDEVAANAVLHTCSGLPGGRFEVVIRHRADAARAEVWDAGARAEPGEPAPPDWSKEAGRGLFLVSMLAKEWGSQRVDSGRVVWFELRDAHDGLSGGSGDP